MTDERFPASRPARHARELLSHALGLLQSPDLPREAVAKAVEHTASASSALYSAENEAESEQASTSGVRIAIEQLGRALAELQDLALTEDAVAGVTEAVARTLALLYPVARGQQRRRREAVMIQPEQRDAPCSEAQTLRVPPAPAPYGRPRKSTPPFGGRDKRQRGTRVFVEVDIGLASESHFYTGLSQDLSSGGVFIATYQASPPGTDIAVYFALPDGHVIEAEGLVRWTREASDDAPPGMGVAFKRLAKEDVAAIERFCQQRAPLFYEDD